MVTAKTRRLATFEGGDKLGGNPDAVNSLTTTGVPTRAKQEA